MNEYVRFHWPGAPALWPHRHIGQQGLEDPSAAAASPSWWKGSALRLSQKKIFSPLPPPHAIK